MSVSFSDFLFFFLALFLVLMLCASLCMYRAAIQLLFSETTLHSPGPRGQVRVNGGTKRGKRKDRNAKADNASDESQPAKRSKAAPDADIGELGDGVPFHMVRSSPSVSFIDFVLILAGQIHVRHMATALCSARTSSALSNIPIHLPGALFGRKA